MPKKAKSGLWVRFHRGCLFLERSGAIPYRVRAHPGGDPLLFLSALFKVGRGGFPPCRQGGSLQQVPPFDPVFPDLQYGGHEQDTEDGSDGGPYPQSCHVAGYDGEQECRHDAPVA